MITIFNFLDISILMFFFGVWGVVIIRTNLLITLICLELILLSINFTFLIFGFYLDDAVALSFSLFSLTVGAAESAIGLSILISYFKVYDRISTDFLGNLKG